MRIFLILSTIMTVKSTIHPKLNTSSTYKRLWKPSWFISWKSRISSTSISSFLDILNYSLNIESVFWNFGVSSRTRFQSSSLSDFSLLINRAVIFAHLSFSVKFKYRYFLESRTNHFPFNMRKHDLNTQKSYTKYCETLHK